MTATDHRYLERIKGRWRVAVAVPHPLHAQLGTKLKRSLHTASLREAQRLRWPVVAELKATIATIPESPASPDEAEAWRAALAASTGEPCDPVEAVEAALSDHLDRVERQHGTAAAVELSDRVYNRATPITTHVSAFLASRGELRRDTKARHETAIGGLVNWLKRSGLPQTIQTIDRKTATRYVDQLPPGHRAPERLSLFWQWLVKREHAQTDPWHGLSAPPRTPIEPERPFEDDEVRRLLAGPAPPALRDLMMVAALSGARVDAIVRMKIEDDCFVFPPQKKEIKARKVPIHSALRGFSPHWPWLTSNAASKVFTRYRRSLGIGGDGSGRRRAVANFHSFRRWFITKAEQAGQPENIIAAVVGHRRPGLSFGRYSAGPSMEQLRACVESVRVPWGRATEVEAT
jgi:integrase